jgi:hypothetical protein
MTRFAALLATALALTLTSGAAAVGPALPDLSGALNAAGEVSFVTKLHGATTLLSKRVEGRVVKTTTLPGGFGIPMVTLTFGQRGGLSPNGRVLVLGDDVHPDGTLRARSRFAVVDASSLTLLRTISLRGDYSFDALSPAGRWLYLIHHVASSDNRYQVQAYDLRSGTLLPGVIADKTQASWLMAGYPVSRTTGPGGRWVYTLYDQGDTYPFVHALDTVTRTAVCVGIPWQWADPGSGIDVATLSLHGHTLSIAGGTSRFRLDTRTFRVTRPKS